MQPWRDGETGSLSRSVIRIINIMEPKYASRRAVLRYALGVDTTLKRHQHMCHPDHLFLFDGSGDLQRRLEWSALLFYGLEHKHETGLPSGA